MNNGWSRRIRPTSVSNREPDQETRTGLEMNNAVNPRRPDRLEP
jgi:hypothetical protein